MAAVIEAEERVTSVQIEGLVSGVGYARIYAQTTRL
jgi:hypothetical protein